MHANEIEEVEIDLRELLYAIWNRIGFVILSSLLFAAAVFIFTKLVITPQYVSTVSLYVMNRQNAFQLTSSDLSASTTLTSDVEVLATSRTVLEKVIEQFSLDTTAAELAKQVTVNNPPNTRILEISALDPDPHTAKQIADAIADVSKEQIVDLMGIEQVNVIDYGNVPGAPASPELIKNVAIGAMAGALITIALIVIIFIYDDSIRTTEDVEKYLGISVLGAIPAGEFVQSTKGRKHQKKARELPSGRRSA